MNEVNISPAVLTAVEGTASSAGSGERRTGTADAGNTLPLDAVQAAEAQGVEAVIADEAVSQAVAELNSFVQSEQRDLLFSVDDGSGDMVVRVHDRESGDLIRQIPNQVVLDLAARARQNEPLQLINMHG